MEPKQLNLLNRRISVSSGSGCDPSEGPLPWFVTRLAFPAAILLTCGLIMAMHEADPDLWGHIQYGREILQTGELPSTATWTFTAEGHRWVNHENIAELTLAWTFDTWGTSGLTFGKYLLGLGIIGLGYWTARRRGVHPLLIGGMCLITALSLEFHWHFRPQVFGYVFFAILAALLQEGLTAPSQVQSPTKLRGGRWQLVAMIPLMTLWTNTHGSFAAGLAVTLAVLGIEVAWRFVAGSLNWFSPASDLDTEQHSRRTLWRLAGLGGLVTLATCLNPYGPSLHFWLIEDVILPRPEIGDWQPMALLSGDRESLCFWMISVSLGLILWQAPRRQWSFLVVTLLLTWQALSHVRHLALLAIVWLMWCPVPLEQLRRQFLTFQTRESPASSGRPSGWLGVGTSVVLAVWMVAVCTWTWPKVTRIVVDGTRYPVDALAFIKANRLEGRTLVTFNWAQYAIGFFADAGMNSTVSADGRLRTCYPQEVIDRHFDFLFGRDYTGGRYRSPDSGPIDPLAALTVDQPDYVLISRRQRPSVRTMESQTDTWKLIYQDGLSQLWAKRDRLGACPVFDAGDGIATRSATFPGFPTEIPGVGAPLLTATP